MKFSEATRIKGLTKDLVSDLYRLCASLSYSFVLVPVSHGVVYISQKIRSLLGQARYWHMISKL